MLEMTKVTQMTTLYNSASLGTGHYFLASHQTLLQTGGSVSASGPQHTLLQGLLCCCPQLLSFLTRGCSPGPQAKISALDEHNPAPPTSSPFSSLVLTEAKDTSSQWS